MNEPSPGTLAVRGATLSFDVREGTGPAVVAPHGLGSPGEPVDALGVSMGVGTLLHSAIRAMFADAVIPPAPGQSGERGAGRLA